jgi:hypothetical protein
MVESNLFSFLIISAGGIMRHRPYSLIFITLTFLLTVMPCRGGTPTPVGNTPDLQSMTIADITVSPIAYQGPILSDIGMKFISYEGPDLKEITVQAIHFSGKALSIAAKPSSSKTASPSAMSPAVVLVPRPIPGVQHRLKILSPKPGQTFTGSVPLEVEITGWQGVPRVDLDWWWSAPTPAGQWPATPQGMTIVNHLNGKTRIIIPSSAFPKSGLWRIKATVTVSDKQHVSDDVSFTLSGLLKQTSKAGATKMAPKQTAPGAMPVHPATTQKAPPLPATPAGRAKTLSN